MNTPDPDAGSMLQPTVRGGCTGGVAITVQARTLVVGLDFAVPPGPLVTNALKHYFPLGAGTIPVVLRQGQGCEDNAAALSLIVRDDGVGVPWTCGLRGHLTQRAGARLRTGRRPVQDP